MYLKTYKNIITFFSNNHGYASFNELKNNGITITQINELLTSHVVEKFSRGWYWCNECGLTKPIDYKYIELAKINPKAIICLESALYLNHIIPNEPECISFATARSDRRAVELSYNNKRYFFTNMGDPEEKEIIQTDFGNYYYFNKTKTLSDCQRHYQHLDKSIQITLENYNIGNLNFQKRMRCYQEKLK